MNGHNTCSRHKQKKCLNIYVSGTSVDGSISSQVGKFKPDDSQMFHIEQPEMNGQLQNTVVDKV